MITKLRDIEEQSRRGEISSCEFELRIEQLFNRIGQCPKCRHTHDPLTQCETILFDGLNLMTTCTCTRGEE